MPFSLSTPLNVADPDYADVAEAFYPGENAGGTFGATNLKTGTVNTGECWGGVQFLSSDADGPFYNNVNDGNWRARVIFTSLPVTPSYTIFFSVKATTFVPPNNGTYFVLSNLNTTGVHMEHNADGFADLKEQGGITRRTPGAGPVVGTNHNNLAHYCVSWDNVNQIGRWVSTSAQNGITMAPTGAQRLTGNIPVTKLVLGYNNIADAIDRAHRGKFYFYARWNKALSLASMQAKVADPNSTVLGAAPASSATKITALFRTTAGAISAVKGSVWTKKTNGCTDAKLFNFGYTGDTVGPQTFAAVSGGSAKMSIALPVGVTLTPGDKVLVYLETSTEALGSASPIVEFTAEA